MSRALALVKASDGSAAADMTVDLYSAWTATKIGQPVSFQATNPAGASGVWKVQGTNDDTATYSATPSTLSTALYWDTPTQPSGTAGETSITVQATHEHTRVWWDRTSGGTGVLATVRYSLGASGVVVVPPDTAITPALSSAAIRALATDQAKLTTLAAAQTELSALASDATALGALADVQTALSAVAADATPLGVLADKSLTGTGNLVCADSPTISTKLRLGATDLTAAEAVVLKVLADLSAPPGWEHLQAKRIDALVVDGSGDPILTGLWYQHLVPNANGTSTLATGVAQAPRAGGGWRITGGGENSSWVHISKQVIQNPSTKSWALAWRGSFNAPDGGGSGYRLGFVGLGGEDTGGYGCYVGEYYSYGDQTKIVLQLQSAVAGGPTNVVTSLTVDPDVLHDWLLAFNQVSGTVTLQCDGVTIGSTTTLTHLPTTPMHIVGRGNDSHFVDVTRVILAYEED